MHPWPFGTVWLVYSDTKASEKISSIINNKYFCSDVKKLSPVYQTSICEAFHSVVINFAPKSTAFTYNGMLARYLMCSHLLHNFHLTLHDFLDYRLHLAALHYNENSGRNQAETKQGKKDTHSCTLNTKEVGTLFESWWKTPLMASYCTYIIS